MIVKICGIKTMSAASAAVDAGADWLGFVFAPSKRRILPDQAKAIIQTLPSTVKAVGVFVNEDVRTMKFIAEKVGLNILQLHGDEDPHIIDQLPYITIKAFSIDQINDVNINSYLSDYYLMDSPRTTFYGGTGRSFDWTVLHDQSLNLNKVILAGGLTCKNVQQAIQMVRPRGVDVSSGVETDGKKDNDKIRHFIQQAKNIRGVVEQ